MGRVLLIKRFTDYGWSIESNQLGNIDFDFVAKKSPDKKLEYWAPVMFVDFLDGTVAEKMKKVYDQLINNNKNTFWVSKWNILCLIVTTSTPAAVENLRNYGPKNKGRIFVVRKDAKEVEADVKLLGQTMPFYNDIRTILSDALYLNEI